MEGWRVEGVSSGGIGGSWNISGVSGRFREVFEGANWCQEVLEGSRRC